MNQTAAIIDALKKELKAAGITYAQVAKQLGLSENSIKRLFGEQKLSLNRLEDICEMIGIDISDLMQRMLERRNRLEELSQEQEAELATNTKLLLVTVCVLNRWSFDDIVATYAIEETECIQLLAKLDRLKLIELLPGNRIRLMVARNFRWRQQGPVQAFFHRIVQPDFFNSRFTSAGEKLAFKSGMLSRNANAIMMQKIEQLIHQFDDLHEQDSHLPIDQRFGTGIVVALRAWEFSAFRDFRRDTNKKTF